MLLWTSTCILEILKLHQPVRSSSYFCWISPKSPLLHKSEQLQWWYHRSFSLEEIVQEGQSFQSTSSRHGQEKGFSGLWFPVTTLSDKPQICIHVLTSEDQDDALSAAGSVCLDRNLAGRFCPVQWTASCSAHTWWHHHRSVVLCTSSASCWQGTSLLLWRSSYESCVLQVTSDATGRERMKHIYKNNVLQEVFVFREGYVEGLRRWMCFFPLWCTERPNVAQPIKTKHSSNF